MPNPFDSYTDMFLFRTGCSPTWEDPSNVNGGRLVIPIHNHSHHTTTLRIWMRLVIVVFHENWEKKYKICGIALNIRAWGDCISMWNTDDDKILAKNLKRELRTIVMSRKIGYISHKDKIKNKHTSPAKKDT
eukprot:TRINITY_DN322_c1_g1_i3.p2 TRINITY_DN322_c1_g1~~TRINITY_DN322_c1_g1_i3.p2  ORF type:complete len:132 (-),score=11.44 TRINITY_DN322_c1_g1_i3:128-523(-)